MVPAGLMSLLAFSAIACGSSSAASPTADSPDATETPVASLEVVTTIYPVTYFAERVGGDRAHVTSLVRPGVDAHDFEPTPGEIISIGKADVLLYTHPSFESWIDNAVSSVANDSLLVVRTADLPGEGIEEPDDDDGNGHDHGGEGTDPHVWLNPIEAVEQVRAIQEAFTTADASGAETYRQNADTLVAELLELDAEIASGLGSCELDHIVVSHEAYGHLAGRYEVEQIGLADLSAEVESTPRRIAEIIEQMRALGVNHILQEPILSDDLANTVAAETGAAILPLHPLEALTPDETEAGDDYFIVMRRNLESLKTALRCD